MPFRKKVLYYGLLLFLTLLALEGMARIAYYAAYGEGYGKSGAAALLNSDAPPQPPDYATAPALPKRINHPFYGYTRDLPEHSLNDMPPWQRREDTVVIGLLGGSVARDAQPFFQEALNRHFTANRWPRRPVVRDLTIICGKQPQQAIIVAHQLLLGGEFDLLVNLDGRNEIVCSAYNTRQETFPFFPRWWKILTGLNGENILRAGRIAVLRQEQAGLTAAGETALLRWSAVFGLANRYRQERVAAEIIQRNHELAAAESAYSLEKHGPRDGAEEFLPAAARVWYRGSVALAELAELAGAEYYHFLQPNQYVPGAKPLSPAELTHSYAPEHPMLILPARGYPLLTDFSPELLRAGINYFDLTRIFVDHPETLYSDACCHLNAQGNELLAAAMVQRLAPALRRFGDESPEPPVSALAAARRPAAEVRLLAGKFQVYLRDNKRLRYVRADCAPADTAARFFLHLTPRDVADLPPHRREPGFDNRDFSFAEAGGRLWQGQCLAEIRLPPYPIAYLRTGQYAPDAGELWAGESPFPE